MRLSYLALTLAAVAAVPAVRAQAVLDVRSTCDTAGTPGCQSVARTVFRSDDSGGVLATGILGVGAIPATGAGERMMWHPQKAAFRAGSIGSAGTQWDEANVGYYTTSFGYNTAALGLAAFSAGYQARAFGSYSTAIGFNSLAGGGGGGTGAVALGYRATADADYAVAIGQRASANGHAGAFVIADGSTTDSLEASANNQFNARYAGGYRLYTNATETVGVQLAAGGSSWTVVSDRNRKEAFEQFDAEALLQRIAQMPITTWHYRDTETTDRHVGPMAQDWQALVDDVLGLNTDDLTINQGDFDGVNLAGIQALEARTRTLAAENDALQAQVDALQAELMALRAERTADAARFARVEAVLARLVSGEAPGTVMATAAPGGDGQP